ncbi:MAG: Cro/CI family transcriptional regulator [Burkholderiaceae bacterium]
MKTKQAIDFAGSATALARILGISPAAICQWNDQVPKARLWQLQVMRPEWFRAPKTDKSKPCAANAV